MSRWWRLFRAVGASPPDEQFCEQVGVDRSVGNALLGSDTDELRDFFLEALDEGGTASMSKRGSNYPARL